MNVKCNENDRFPTSNNFLTRPRNVFYHLYNSSQGKVTLPACRPIQPLNLVQL